MMRKLSILLTIVLVSTQSSAAIIQNESSLKFTADNIDELEDEQYTIRMLEFRKFKQTTEGQLPENSIIPYSIASNRQYKQLAPFLELLQFSDFRVSPKKDFAIVYSATCSREAAAAQNPWKCKLFAVKLNHEGYVEGKDVQGDFIRAEFHKTMPYIFFIRDSAGDSKTYAEIYDMDNKKIRTIKAFDESMLERPNLKSMSHKS